MKRIRSDSRYSALLSFRHWRKIFSLRVAYWLTVARYGWTEWQKPAYNSLPVNAKRALRVA